MDGQICISSVFVLSRGCRRQFLNLWRPQTDYERIGRLSMMHAALSFITMLKSKKRKLFIGFKHLDPQSININVFIFEYN